ncbi:MAG: ABC transporter ATP-binding protein [Methanomassiliicoccales archaeon]|nr:ABC transporter ATP-binding protein [Methanomassiliicoccales archaeon]
MTTAIVVDGLNKTYEDVRAVDGVSFSVQSGEIFSLLGHNGAGKTTTVEILEGLRNPTSGSAHILGVDVTNGYGKIRGKVGILPQDFEPFENLKPIEAVEYWAALYGRKLSKQECHELLCSVDLAHRENALSKHLSGGEKRKLGIALAMVNRPEVLFLDEPTTGLDPKARRDLWELIVSLKKSGTTIFLTTHYLDEAEVLSDHIAIMNKGKIVAEGSPRQIIQEFGRSATVTLFGAGQRGLEEMRRQGVDATLVNEDVIVGVPDPSRIEHWFAGLSEAGVEVKDMSIKRDTLEDVFLSLISKKAEGVAR